MMTTVSAQTPKEKSITQGSPNSRLSPSTAATVAALLMKPPREGAPANSDLARNRQAQSPATATPDMNSVFRAIFQQMANPNAHNTNTTTTNSYNYNNTLASTSTTPNLSVANSNADFLSSFSRAHYALPTVLANLALTNPLVLSPTAAVTKPEPLTPSQASSGGDQTVTVANATAAAAANGQVSPGQNAGPSHSHSFTPPPPLPPLGYPVMTSKLFGSGPVPTGAANQSISGSGSGSTVVGCRGNTPMAAVPGSLALAHTKTPGTGGSGSTLASIVNITSVLSPSLSGVGVAPFLTACTPLLQLAVRQAITDCISTCGQVTIRGQLEVTVSGSAANNNDNKQQIHSAINNEATVVLNFDDKTTSVDHQPSPPAEQIAWSASDHHRGDSHGQTTNSNQFNDRHNRTLVDGEGRRLSTVSQSSTGSSSRRKRPNPSRCNKVSESDRDPVTDYAKKLKSFISAVPLLAISVNGAQSPSSSMAMPSMWTGSSTTSPCLWGNQGSPKSPSADSGVLDLSRGASLANSAPMTPMKSLSLTAEANLPLTLVNDVSRNGLDHSVMLEAYQTLTNLQAAMMSKTENTHEFNTANIGHTAEGSHNQLAFNFYQLAQQFHQSQQQQPYPASSAPLHQQLANSLLYTGTTSPTSFDRPSHKGVTSSLVVATAKGIRRQRLSMDSSRGHNNRMSVLRRSSSSRRFPCNQCRDEFPSLHILEEHTVTKHGSYRCHVCQAQFTQRSNLQRHALKHVGFKPFECRVCNKAYYRKDHLMRHMEMGHPGFTPRDNITVHLTSSESLEFLNRTTSNVSFISTNSTVLAKAEDSEMDCSTFDLKNGIIKDEFRDDAVISPMGSQLLNDASPQNDILNVLEISADDRLRQDNNSCAGSMYQTNSDGRCASNDCDHSISNGEDAELGGSPPEHGFHK